MTYTALPVSLDGTGANLGAPEVGFGVDASRYLLFSVWMSFNASPTWTASVGQFTGHGGFSIAIQQNAHVQVVTSDNSGQIGSSTFTTISPAFTLGSLMHVLVSVDTFTGAAQYYLNDVAQAVSSSSWPRAPSSIKFNGDLFSFSASTIGSACVADFYVNTPGQFADLSQLSVRRKFIDASGNPVFLGDDGSFPTLSQPQVYLTMKGKVAPKQFLRNAGSMTGLFTNAALGPGSFCSPLNPSKFTPPLLPTTNFDPSAYDVLQLVTTEGPDTQTYWVERTTKMFDVTDTLEDAWFLDDAVQATAAIDTGLSTGVKLYGLWHLRGKTGISAWISGFDCGTHTIAADGTLVVPYGSDPDGLFTQDIFLASKQIAIVGYSFTSQGQILRPGEPQQAGAANGPPMGKTRRSHMFSALMVNAVGVSFGTDFTTARVAQFSTPSGTAYNKGQMFSGTYQGTLDDNYSFDSMLCWQVTRPYPVTVASVSAYLHTQDR